MNLFNAIRRRYIDFLNYRDESQECFVNKNGEIIANKNDGKISIIFLHFSVIKAWKGLKSDSCTL